MADAEKQQYQFQLEQIERLLAEDPSNEELQGLKRDIEELLALYAEANDVTTSQVESVVKDDQPNQNNNDNKKEEQEEEQEEKQAKFRVGTTVLARWSRDSRFYEAVVTEVVGDKYTVLYPKYGLSEQLKSSDVKEFDAAEAQAVLEENERRRKRKMRKTGDSGSGGQPGDRKKSKKQMEEEIHEQKKQSWQQFASKIKRPPGSSN